MAFGTAAVATVMTGFPSSHLAEADGTKSATQEIIVSEDPNAPFCA